MMNRNSAFEQYVKTSKDLNPVINGKTYSLPAKRGEFFFHYQAMQLDPEYRKDNYYWIRNFQVLLTNGEPVMPADLLDEMKADGSSNYFYNALGGYYDYEAYQHVMGETKLDFGDPEYTILSDENGKKLPREMRDGTWRYDIAEHHKEWLLNPGDAFGGRSSGDFGGYYGGKAFYFDFAADPKGLAAYMAGVLQEFSEKSHYNGAFFDYCSAGWKGGFLPKRAMSIFARKYHYLTPDGQPDLERACSEYDKAAGWFLYLLRQKLPRDIEMFANQCFYSYKDYYPAMDHDITESYFVSFAYGRDGKEVFVEDETGVVQKVHMTQTFYRGVKDSITDASPEARANTAEDTVSMGENENTVSAIVARALPAIETARTFAGCPKFYFLDYMIPRLVPTGKMIESEPVYKKQTDREAIYYALTWYRLFNCEGSVSDWYGGEGRYDKDDLYFIDLGKTLNSSYLYYSKDGIRCENADDSDYVIRFFENGFVLVSSEPVRKSMEFQIDAQYLPGEVQGIYDMFERSFSQQTDRVTVNPNHYDMLDGYVNPHNAEDVDDGYRPVGRVFMYIK